MVNIMFNLSLFLKNFFMKFILILILSVFLVSCSSAQLPSLPDLPNWAKPSTTINKVKDIFTKEDSKEN